MRIEFNSLRSSYKIYIIYSVYLIKLFNYDFVYQRVH